MLKKHTKTQKSIPLRRNKSYRTLLNDKSYTESDKTFIKNLEILDKSARENRKNLTPSKSRIYDEKCSFCTNKLINNQMIRIHGKNKFCEKCTKNILSSKDPTADPIFTLMRKEFSDKDFDNKKNQEKLMKIVESLGKGKKTRRRRRKSRKIRK